MENGRAPDPADPAAGRSGEDVEQASPVSEDAPSSEESGAEPAPAETFDEEGAGLAAKE
jgi:hypothetical protein